MIRIVAVVLILCSCATNTGDAKKDARGRAVNQTLREAGKILGNTAVAILFNAAKSEATDEVVDYQHAAVAGLYANMDLTTGASAVKRIVDAYSGGKAPDTAKAAEKAFAESILSPEERVDAIAKVITEATSR